MDECDLTWVTEHRGMCAGASGRGFLPGHTWEDILLPVFGDNEEMNVVIRPLVILVA